MQHLTFYGHFTGHSSYPVVCKAIARWLIARDYDFTVANLREQPVDAWLAKHQVPFYYTGDCRATQRKPAKGASLLFGFPEWHQAIPRHDTSIGYHVADVSPAPPAWFAQIEQNCDLVLTPSEWCKGLFEDTLGITKPIHIVRHGIDSQVFRPQGLVNGPPTHRTVLRHYCSSPTFGRKGTVEVVRAAEKLIQAREDVAVKVSAPSQTRYLLEPYKERPSSKGSGLQIVFDRATEPSEIASNYRGYAVIVQPSRAEGFGMQPLEAVACGAPVVVTSVTGHAEWYKTAEPATLHVETGLDAPCGEGMAPSLDERSLYDVMLRAVDERVALREDAMEASHEVRTQWDWWAVLDRDLAPVLQSIVG